MGQITVSVNNRSYVVACEDGQEEHVQSLARYLDRQAQEMTRSVGQVGEGRLLLLSALVVADELSSVLDELDQLKADVVANKAADEAARHHVQAEQQAEQQAVSGAVAAIEQRIDRLTQQVEASKLGLVLAGEGQ